MPIDIGTTFQPQNDGDFPVNEARFISGAALTVATLAERTALEAKPGRLKEGQLVWVVDQQKLYELDAGKASWTEITLGNPNAVTTNGDDQFDNASGGEETAPAVGDRFLLESLANSLQKRWIQLQNIIVSKFRTTGAAVDVGGAAPPTTGQALIATSATVAAWQDQNDADAIHDNVANEIAPLTAPTLAGNDVLLIEDADAGTAFSKAKTTAQDIANLAPAADFLGTTGADVDIGSSAPPNLGDVLTATGATAATWQAPSGGGTSTTINTTIRTTGVFTPVANEINLLDPKTVGPFSVTIPAASGFSNGDVVGFKYALASAAQVTLNRSATDLIEGQTSYVMNQPLGALIFKTDGIDRWWIV